MSRSVRRTYRACGPALAAAVASTALLALASPEAQADKRTFSYSYEATTMALGEYEYEQWVTWSASKSIDSDYDELEFRHELEFAFTENWQGAVYVSDWKYEDGDSVADDGADWTNAAFETIYQISDPVKDPLGVALYGEYKGGDELQAIESKLILQKNIGKWVFAWNGTAEAEWEGESLHEDKGEFKNTLGASYQISPSLSAGAELLHEIEYDDWSEWEDHAVWAGPNASYSAGDWWVTISPLFQLTDEDTQPDFKTRLLFGVFF